MLTNDFFANLLSRGTRWKASDAGEHMYGIRDVATDELKWTATAVDLLFGSTRASAHRSARRVAVVRGRVAGSLRRVWTNFQEEAETN